MNSVSTTGKVGFFLPACLRQSSYLAINRMEMPAARRTEVEQQQQHQAKCFRAP